MCDIRQTIVLDADAPAKPEAGSPCNGCGLCCAAETCPIGLLLFLKRRGPCPALLWRSGDKRYFCGLLVDPGHCSCWLPTRWIDSARSFIARRIAADQGCDSTAEVISPESSAQSDKRQS